ncbi:Gmad2 immunoglobulin-like domain-containing protein [Nocardioides taihuensis]|uniref:Gmad2 immunoglobulin-like domain-containing protein n=1 Tax=Nocardioides taihuensis TaxID=1835606 RepID=A0ABW0BMB9_9ACTN
MTTPDDRWDTDDALATLVVDAVADVEPGDVLAGLRARTRTPARRRWVVPTLTAGVVAAATVVAVAVLGHDTAPTAGPTPLVSPSAPASKPASSAESPTDIDSGAVVLEPAAVYYVGDTPAGPRLYRETLPVRQGDMAGLVERLSEAPADPDYRTLWPAAAFEDASFDGAGADGFFSVTLSDAALAARPAGMSATESSLAVEAVVRSLQDAYGRGRVEFYAPGSSSPMDTVLGVAADLDPEHSGVRSFDRSPDLDVLSQVLLDEPSEGQTYPTGDTLEFAGEAASFEGNVTWRLQRYEGMEIIDQGNVTAEGGDGFYPFSGEVDLTGVPAGRYTFMVWTDDPSGEGNSYTDDRVITIE